MDKIKIAAARLREPIDIEDRVNWGTAFNAGTDHLGATWSLWLDDLGWLCIEQVPKAGPTRRRRTPPSMIRAVDEVAPAPTPAPILRSTDAPITKIKVEPKPPARPARVFSTETK